jgi:hypothetical protein
MKDFIVDFTECCSLTSVAGGLPIVELESVDGELILSWKINFCYIQEPFHGNWCSYQSSCVFLSFERESRLHRIHYYTSQQWIQTPK